MHIKNLKIQLKPENRVEKFDSVFLCSEEYFIGQGISLYRVNERGFVYMSAIKETEKILCKLPNFIRNDINELPDNIISELEEIRLNCGFNTILISGGKEYQLNNSELITFDVLDEILNKILDYSYYAHEDDLSNGFITIEGGHRIGICGRVTLKDGNVHLIKDISSLNIRRSREIIGASDKIISYVVDEFTGVISNTLIISPPKCGKTTILRDLARALSSKGYRVGICDERSEIAGCYSGQSTYDLGIRTDILDACPKAKGIIMLIRAMSPDVIITDEIGKPEDVVAIKEALSAGVKVITTIHGDSYEDIISSSIGKSIESRLFETLIFLTGYPKTGTVKKIMKLDELKKGG